MTSLRTSNALPDISVPGSVSNLGPGFDALSVAERRELRRLLTDTDAG